MVEVISLICFLPSISAMDFLISPEQDARIGLYDPVPVFRWQDIQPGGPYQLQFSLDESFSNPSSIPLTSNLFDLSEWVTPDEWKGLSFLIYWRVAASSTTSPSRWLTKTRLTSPGSDFPFDARFSQSDQAPVITWSEVTGAGTYELEFASNASFEESVIIDWNATTLDLCREVSPEAWQAYEGRLYFRIWAVDSTGLDGPFYGFFSISKCNLPIPDIGHPNGYYFKARDPAPQFVWQPVDGAKGYDFQLAAGGDFDYQSVTYHSKTNSLRLDDYMSQSDWEMLWGAYRWRVCAISPSSAPTPWSREAVIHKCGKHVYAVLGDSISAGGVCGVPSWVLQFESDVKRRYGWAKVYNESVGGMKSKWGAWRIEDVVSTHLPEFVLILFGTNDAVDPGNCQPPYECRVAEHLEEMVFIARSYGVTPIISNVLPVNPDGERAYAQDRVNWYNEEIYAMVDGIDTPLLDLNAVFWSTPDISALFCDWGHPSIAGSLLIGSQYFQSVITYD